MVWRNKFGIGILIFIIVADGGLTRRQSCREKGYVNAKGREVTICSKDSDGKLTIKTLSCGENSHFSLEEKKCVQQSTQNYQPNWLHPSDNTQVQYAYMAPHMPHSYGAPQPVYLPGYPLMAGFLPPPLAFSPFARCPFENEKFCDTCNTLVTCENYLIRRVEHCNGCDPYMKVCTNNFNSECCSCGLTCTSIGLFPDAYFCNRYHYCPYGGVPSVVNHCGPGRIFDFNSDECKYDPSRMHHSFSPCPNFPKCADDFQVDALPTNPRFYAICLEDEHTHELKRSIWKCDKGKVYEENSGICM